MARFYRGRACLPKMRTSANVIVTDRALGFGTPAIPVRREAADVLEQTGATRPKRRSPLAASSESASCVSLPEDAQNLDANTDSSRKHTDSGREQAFDVESSGEHRADSPNSGVQTEDTPASCEGYGSPRTGGGRAHPGHHHHTAGPGCVAPRASLGPAWPGVRPSRPGVRPSPPPPRRVTKHCIRRFRRFKPEIANISIL